MAAAIGRRLVLGGGTVAAWHARTAWAALPEGVVAAARREGTLVFHTSIEVALCERMIAAFNAVEPGIKVQLERTGAERILQRINQEYSSNIFAADVVESSDIGMFVDWKARGWLAAFVPEDVAAHWPETERDPDGCFASVRASLSVMAHNTRQVKVEDAPTSFVELLQPKWRMRMVKAHPGYSGSILNSTYCTARALGWPYFEALARQRVLQVQSAVEPPKKVAIGERPVQVDGSEYFVLQLADQGAPIRPIYATEGSPIFSGPAAVFARASHPNAARVFTTFLFSLPCQQIMVEQGGLRSFHPGVKERAGHVPLSEIKLLRATPAELVAGAEETKRRYAAAFGV